MPQISERTGMPRKELTVFYVLDTSGSMGSDGKITALNCAMEESIVALTDLAKSNGDAKLKIAILEFNSGYKWVTLNGPEYLEEDFEYEHLKAGGLTDMGAALKELNNKLSRHSYLQSMTGALMPIIIFMTDGMATDDWKSGLEVIRKNKWFNRGTKIGFAIGEDPDVAMIASVVGNSEAVIKTTDLELFRKLMRFVTVTSSMLVSTSQTPDTAVDAGSIVKDAIKQTDSEGNVEEVKLKPVVDLKKVTDGGNEYVPEPEVWEYEEEW